MLFRERSDLFPIHDKIFITPNSINVNYLLAKTGTSVRYYTNLLQ